MPLATGDKAPDFSLPDQTGEPVSLSDYKGRKVLIFFYPKALTGGCTAQACGLRDIAGNVGDTAILGISPDKPTLQAKFDNKHGLGYPLLSDPDHATADAYSTWGEKSLYGKKYMGIIRSAFLVDEDGNIEHAWYKVSPADTVPKAMEVLEAE